MYARWSLSGEGALGDSRQRRDFVGLRLPVIAATYTTPNDIRSINLAFSFIRVKELCRVRFLEGLGRVRI